MTDTLRSICERCAYLHNPRLEFIAAVSQREKQIILRDLKQLVLAASSEQEKGVVVLAGADFESILYCFVRSQSDYIGRRRGEPFEFKADESLDYYVRVFNKWLSDAFSFAHRIPDLVVDYRNFVHFNCELRDPPGACALAAREMLVQLNGLMETLAEYAATGPPASGPAGPDASPGGE